MSTTAPAKLPSVEIPAAMLARITHVQQRMAAVELLLKTVLQAGVDYGQIPGTPKPTLYQPGAQTIDHALGLAPKFETMAQTIDLDRIPQLVAVTVKCMEVNVETGEIVAEGIGACTSLEVKYRYRSAWEGGERVRVENPEVMDLYNTLWKMAAKRAHVAACLNASGASRIFTQDLEDIEALAEDARQGSGGRPAAGAGQPQSAGNGAPRPRSTNSTEPSSEAQRKMIYAKGKALGINDADARAWIKAKWDVESTKDLTKAQASEAINTLIKVEKGETSWQAVLAEATFDGQAEPPAEAATGA